MTTWLYPTNAFIEYLDPLWVANLTLPEISLELVISESIVLIDNSEFALDVLELHRVNVNDKTVTTYNNFFNCFIFITHPFFIFLNRLR